MEAWLKFTAPGVTLTVGLSIGQVVFNALNKVELVIGILISVLVISGKEKIQNGAFAIAFLVLMAETFWLLPSLSLRVDLILSGATPGKSNLHLIFIIMEVIKVVALRIYGIKQMKYGKYKTTHTWANSNA